MDYTKIITITDPAEVWAAEVIEKVASIESVPALRKVQNAIRERADFLTKREWKAKVDARWEEFATLRLGTKITYALEEAYQARIAQRLGLTYGFIQPGTYELRARRVYMRGRHKGRRFVWLASRFDDPSSEWIVVEDKDLASDRFKIVKEE